MMKESKHLRLATVCEVEKANRLSDGVLGQILRNFWSRDNHISFWNYTEIAFYELQVLRTSLKIKFNLNDEAK